MQASTNTPTSNQEDNVHSQAPEKRNVLTDFEMYGWTPDSHLSLDDNYMDLVMLLTRNSHCRNGSMGCVLINKDHSTVTVNTNRTTTDGSSMTKDTTAPATSSSLMDHHYHHHDLQDSIIGAGTNQSFYKDGESDVHAEIAALGQAARYGNSTDGCTAYITMPPCKNCFMALTMAGVQRIVSRYPPPEYIAPILSQRGIHVTTLSDHETSRRSRINKLILDHRQDRPKAASQSWTSSNHHNNDDDVFQRRKQRKEEKQNRKEKYRAKQQGRATAFTVPLSSLISEAKHTCEKNDTTEILTSAMESVQL